MPEFQKSRFCEACESKYAGSEVCPYCGGKGFPRPVEKPKPKVKVEGRGR